MASVSSQYFTEESDDLWMRHCQRDFKRDTPQEYESWREMYLRLHEEREERLRKLTMNISSAHANKPKGAVISTFRSNLMHQLLLFRKAVILTHKKLIQDVCVWGGIYNIIIIIIILIYYIIKCIYLT